MHSMLLPGLRKESWSKNELLNTYTLLGLNPSSNCVIAQGTPAV